MSEALPWFRMYSEFLTDPIVRLLSFEDQRHFVAALCMKCSGVLDKPYATPELRLQVISSLIGLSSEIATGSSLSALDQANQRLRLKGLVDGGWNPVNWSKRQFQSDRSAVRTRKWRERHSDVTVTGQNRYRTDTDTEQNKKGAEAPECPQGLDSQAWERWSSYRSAIRKPIKPASEEAAMKSLASFGALQGDVVEQSVANGWQGLFPLGRKTQGPERTWRPGPEDSGPC